MNTTEAKPNVWNRWWLAAAFILAVCAMVVLGIGRKSKGWTVQVMWPPNTWKFQSVKGSWISGNVDSQSRLITEEHVDVSNQYGPVMFLKQTVVTNVTAAEPDGVVQEKWPWQMERQDEPKASR